MTSTGLDGEGASLNRKALDTSLTITYESNLLGGEPTLCTTKMCGTSGLCARTIDAANSTELPYHQWLTTMFGLKLSKNAGSSANCTSALGPSRTVARLEISASIEWLLFSQLTQVVITAC